MSLDALTSHDDARLERFAERLDAGGDAHLATVVRRALSGPNTPDAGLPDAMTPPTSPPWLPFVARIRAFVAGRVPQAEADDVVQDAMLRMHEAAHTLRDTDRAEAWAYGIARRTIADFYRRRSVPTEAGDLDAIAAPALPHENLAHYAGDHAVHEEVLSWIRPFVDALPEPDRQALLLADFQGHTQQEVADALGLSLSGAKSRVQRARTRVGQALRACCTVEFGPDARATAFRRVCETC